MDISFSTSTYTTNAGYGVAGFGMVTSLQKLGYHVLHDDASCPVHIEFHQPPYWTGLGRGQYLIGYVPWESSEMEPLWKEKMNVADEIWTPNPIQAERFKACGVTTPIRIYEHGYAEEWTNLKRRSSGKIKFLHCGEPAPRKCGQMVVDAFIAAFGENEDISLTIKAWNSSMIRINDDRGFFRPDQLYKNIHTLYQELTPDAMVSLHHAHHVAVLPTWGEGFGLFPIQALVTGMPTITNGAALGYSRHILPQLNVRSSLADSPWPQMHPGKMFKPDFDDLVDKMRYAVDHFDELSGRALLQSQRVKKEYSWENVTKKADEYLREIESKLLLPASIHGKLGGY
jgi:glycosyltransferase involved in cell wall biosynthesis